jgi:hypothetical protein
MIELGILQQAHGADGWKGVFSDNRLNVVTEINNVGFPEA